MSIYRRVLHYYKPFWGQTIAGLFLSMVGIGLNLLKPWPFKIIVDDFLRPTAAARGDWRTWVPLLCLALVVIQFVWGIINWITNYLFVKIRDALPTPVFVSHTIRSRSKQSTTKVSPIFSHR
jgi:ABC-type multidrug transport system fused ATPase/permease subunit